MIQTIQNWIWNIGGFILTIIIFLAIITWIFNWIINNLSGWHNKEFRENLFYWIANKKRLNEIIEKEKNEKQR